MAVSANLTIHIADAEEVKAAIDRLNQQRAELYAALANIMTGKREGRAAMMREIYHAEQLLERIDGGRR